MTGPQRINRIILWGVRFTDICVSMYMLGPIKSHKISKKSIKSGCIKLLFIALFPPVGVSAVISVAIDDLFKKDLCTFIGIAFKFYFSILHKKTSNFFTIYNDIKYISFFHKIILLSKSQFKFKLLANPIHVKFKLCFSCCIHKFVLWFVVVYNLVIDCSFGKTCIALLRQDGNMLVYQCQQHLSLP